VLRRAPTPSWERFQAERSLAQRVAGAITDDPDTIELYFGYASPLRARQFLVLRSTLDP
jgi:hypothetical protein